MFAFLRGYFSDDLAIDLGTANTLIYVLGKGGSRKEIPTHPRVWALAQERPRVGWLFPSRSSVGHVTSLSVSTLTTRLFSS